MILEVTSRSLSQHDWQALDPAVVCPAMPSGRAWGARHGGYGGAACVVGVTGWLWCQCTQCRPLPIVLFLTAKAEMPRHGLGDVR